jgi:hypothetical protein
MKDWKRNLASLMAVVAIMLSVLFVFDPEIFFPPSEEVDVSEITEVDSNKVHNNPTDGPVLIDFVEENQDYLGTVNEGIQLEQLQDLKSLYSMKLINANSVTYAAAIVEIFDNVVAVEGRTITLASDNFSIYIGESAVIIFYEGRASSHVDVAEIRPGDKIAIAGRLQYKRGDPFYVSYVAVHHQ